MALSFLPPSQFLLISHYFHYIRIMMGSIDGNTSKELLKGHPPGTFLLRLSRSSPGDYAISYIAPSGNYDQVLINYYQDNFWFEGVRFDSIDKILEKEAYTLRIPFAQSANAAINLRATLMTNSTRQQTYVSSLKK